jgi:hypothetical protein
VKSLQLALLVCRFAFAQDPLPGRETTPGKSNARISFNALKSLAGTWIGPVTTDPPNPALEGTIKVTMRVASAGNVLVHEIAPSGVPEPTMVFLDDERLTLIHYCEAGNRPRMVARDSPDRKVIEFDFADISGSTNPAYLNHFVFTMISGDHHIEDWTFVMGDKPLHAHFDLKRAKDSVAPQPGK